MMANGNVNLEQPDMEIGGSAFTSPLSTAAYVQTLLMPQAPIGTPAQCTSYDPTTPPPPVPGSPLQCGIIPPAGSVFFPCNNFQEIDNLSSFFTESLNMSADETVQFHAGAMITDLRGLPATEAADKDSPETLTRGRLMEMVSEWERASIQAKRMAARETKRICVFCRNNGEAEPVYTSHSLKDAKGRIKCPILFKYICPKCGASRERAHTIKYCPMTANHQFYGSFKPFSSAPNSSGRMRANSRF